jgi:hypothetical protein
MTEADTLTAIDDALDAGVPTEDDPVARELQQLALALRADAPEPTAVFSEWLDKRVEQGFPKPARRRVSWRKLTTPAIVTGLIALPIVLIIALGGSGSTNDLSSGGSSGGGGGVAAEKAPAVDSAGGSSSVAAIPPSGGGFAPERADRKIERSFSLELEAPADQMTRVADQVTSVTNRHGGFVLSSSVSTGEDSSGGDFDLRIPAGQVRPALRDLAALAEVRSQSQTGRDVTPQYVTARQRLRSARAERKSLLRRLEAATTDTEADAIRRRLDIVAAEINGLRGKLHNLRLRTNYAVVNVSLLEKDGNGSGGAGGGSFDDALGDAGDILVGMAGVLVRVLAVALPLAFLVLLGWLGGRVLQRRRRESALV